MLRVELLCFLATARPLKAMAVIKTRIYPAGRMTSVQNKLGWSVRIPSWETSAMGSDK